jgi:hypothetical protein
MARASNVSHRAAIRPPRSRIVPDLVLPDKRPQDERAPGRAPSCHIGERLLELAAPIGLSLLVTAGFAAALGLCTELTVSSPRAINACVAFFLWSLAPFSCVTNSRS